MEKFPEVYLIAENLYNKLYNKIDAMIDFIGEKFVEKRLEVLNEFDCYIQSLLVQVSLADNTFDNLEYAFVKKIAKGKSIFQSNSLDDEDLDELNALTKEVLSNVPQFVVLSVECDKKCEDMLKVVNPTFCQVVYDNLRRLSNYLKYVDGSVCSEEDDAVKNELAPIVNYYKKKYVTYAPKRKED